MRAVDFKHATEAETKTQAADQDRGTLDWAAKFAGQVCQKQLRDRGVRAHELSAIEFQKVFPVVFMEGKAGTVRRPCLGKIAKGNHAS
jgi:hypothetical protein